MLQWEMVLISHFFVDPRAPLKSTGSTFGLSLSSFGK
jgi:hypothetical protein